MILYTIEPAEKIFSAELADKIDSKNKVKLYTDPKMALDKLSFKLQNFKINNEN